MSIEKKRLDHKAHQRVLEENQMEEIKRQEESAPALFKPLEHMALAGQRVTLFCLNYIYTGNIKCVGECYGSWWIVLEGSASKKPGIVYETGELNTKVWKDMQELPGDWLIQISAIESLGVLK